MPVKGKKVNPLWRCVGYASLLGSFGILACCMAIGGRAFSCIVNILRGAAGVGSLDLSAKVGKEITQSFYEESIEGSPLDITVYTLIFVRVNLNILKRGVIEGIERSVKFLMPGLFSCLLLMAGRNLTLEGQERACPFI